MRWRPKPNPNRRQTMSMKDHRRETQMFKLRTLFAFGFVLLLMAILIGRMVFLQVMSYEQYQTRSERNRIEVVKVGPTRGLIYDRNGILLAENRSVFSLELVPEQIDNMQQTLIGLQHLLGLSDELLADFVNRLRGERRFNKVPLKTRLSEEEVATFSINKHRFPGVSIEARLIRHYPFGADLVHVLGYVGRISQRDKAGIDEQNYKATRNIGKIGLEKYYEELLHGTIGEQKVETDVHGRVLRVLEQQPPVPGRDIHLNLDVGLQLVAKDALEGRRGAVIALDPNNGGVLALVSNPGYDPNDFVTGISSPKYQALLESPDRPLFNRALRGQYSPGSTIKPHLGWLGLYDNKVTPQYKMPDPGYYVLPNDERKYRDWNWRYGGHGRVDVVEAIAESCDVYFYDLAVKLGIDRIHEAMTLFGFGEYTGIDMGEEVPGLMPSREWKRGARGAPWYPGETVITGIGQGYWTATPLQIANAAAVMANWGIRYQLQLVRGVGYDDAVTPVASELAPEQIPLDKKWAFEVARNGMVKAVSGLKGTARTAFTGAQYTSAGKTGTVQLFSRRTEEEIYDAEKVSARLRDNAMYIGFAPVDEPQIALAVVVENAGGGGSAAAPVARKVMDYFFEQRNELTTQQAKLMLEKLENGEHLFEVSR